MTTELESSIFTYTPDLTRPMCPICGAQVPQDTDTPEIPWQGTCTGGHTFTFQLEDEEGEWLEDSESGRFSRVATEPEESTWVCNECGESGADPYDTGCGECGAEADFF